MTKFEPMAYRSLRLRFTKGVNKAVILGLVDELLSNKEVSRAVCVSCVPDWLGLTGWTAMFLCVGSVVGRAGELLSNVGDEVGENVCVRVCVRC